jgi:Trypsin
MPKKYQKKKVKISYNWSFKKFNVVHFAYLYTNLDHIIMLLVEYCCKSLISMILGVYNIYYDKAISYLGECFRQSKVTVYLGAQDISKSSEAFRQTFLSTKIYNHPQYNFYDQNVNFDIAVVRLPSAATFNGKA